MIFIENKYSRIYYRIIEQAKTRTLPECSYTERHHVFPTSLGGDNSKENLVRLTAQEHFICHKLLVKMTEGAAKTKMIYAWCAMAKLNRENRKLNLTSREFKMVREAWAQEVSKRKKGRTFDQMTPAEQDKMRNMWEKRRGSKMTPESIAQREQTKIERGTRRPPPNHTGRTRKNDTKNKLKNLKWINNGTINTKISSDVELPNGYSYGRCNFTKRQ